MKIGNEKRPLEVTSAEQDGGSSSKHRVVSRIFWRGFADLMLPYCYHLSLVTILILYPLSELIEVFIGN